MQAYEERMLYLLMLMRQPRTRMIYVTSQAILPTTLDYYMSDGYLLDSGDPKM